ncbi:MULTISPECIES: peptidylprolyl isomerase [Sphingobium]|uniref:peptidylprolyl isomerase n=1 Tax=Sphingobium cupriresistens TaxID=1132417 RepID=A0A8G1ZIY9_9SPHN|nr:MULTISPECIES: peptidylprolyl isomerase [Sphingobium]MBJ7377175.1 peptidylprolyl isomerase [Sphingobium sp.]RYM14160.1 peptidylprolyl isomerase [Sphingobium cupriresistens]
MRSFVLCVLGLILGLWPVLSVALPANQPTPGFTRVAIETSAGTITVAVDQKRAPRTSANFLTYVDDGRFDGVTFYRAARRKSDPHYGLIQGGIDTDARRSLPPIPHEPTSRTGILHRDATLSMARPNRPNSAMGNFFITIGATPNMDARGDYIGYAAFGHVVGGMDVVRKILSVPTCCGSGPMRGQMIVKPIRILRARRLDGAPKPTRGVKPWLIGLNKRTAK